MRIRAWLACLGLLGVACSGGPPHNLLLISVDTLRADQLEPYGSPRSTSPALARFAAEGLVFESAISTAPWTLPAHASLLTGLYPTRHGMQSMLHGLPDGLPHLVDWLAKEGYRTGAIVNSRYLGRRYGWSRGFDSFEYVVETAERAAPTEVHARAGAWLEAAPPQPFFLFLHYYDVHSDYRSLPRYEREWVRPYRGPANGSTGQLLEVERGALVFDDADARNLLDRYAAGVRQFDDGFGALMARLDALGLTETTLVVVTSDHGEEFLEHGGVLHGRTLHDEVMRVPLIVRGPGVPAGARLAGAASLVDVAPTALALLGLSPPPQLDGEDLTPHLAGGSLPERSVFAESDRKNAQNDMLRAVRRGRWKLVLDRFDGDVALYDVVDDPGERVDLARRRPEVVTRLRAELDAFMAREAVAEPRLIRGFDPRELEQLRALGYL